MRKYRLKEIVGLSIGLGLFFLVLILPAPAGMSIAAKKVAAVSVLMVSLWITEAAPLAVVSFIPLVFFPLLSISSTKSVAPSYANHNIFLFLGGFCLALAIEKYGLHRRFALNIIKLMGTRPRKIILGFIIATSFLSMWISNTATTMIMLPIALAVIASLDEKLTCYESFAASLMLAVAYSASVGGIATLVGTPPNIVFAGQVKILFPEIAEINFFDWMKVALPFVLVFLFIIWVYLSFFVFKKAQNCLFKEGFIEREMDLSEKMTREEKYTLFFFIFTALAWIFRRNIDLGFFKIPGWSEILGLENFISDSTVAMITAFLLFTFPVNWKLREPLLLWEDIRKIPWEIIFLFGGGFALAAGFKESGLSQWIGSKVGALTSLPLIFMIAGICLLVTFLTEFTSNTATTMMILPLLGSLARANNLHPFLLMLPATISASCAFMLPVATPPNAIVFSSGKLKVKTMLKVGLVFNLVGVILTVAAVYFLGIPLFNIK